MWKNVMGNTTQEAIPTAKSISMMWEIWIMGNQSFGKGEMPL